ncbi:MAG: hypothetical protein WBD36_16660 [Bacteroidota bacterium]
MPLTPEVRNKILEKLKIGLRKQVPPMVCYEDKPGVCGIMGNKAVPYGSTKKIVPGMYFSSVVARKDMVSFYLFPLYYRSKEFSNLAPTMMKCLKGKTCFNFRKEEQVVAKELDALLRRGAKIWKELGYMK